MNGERHFSFDQSTVAADRDSALAERVHRALLDDDRLSGSRVDVSVAHGFVTLSGSVQSHRRKLAAHEIASSFRHCRGVTNDLVVEPPGDLTDSEIAEFVRAALEAHADVTPEVITVASTNGHVTLSGNVGTEWERSLAEDLALSARGVRDVQNLLVVDLAQEVEDESLSHTIREALLHTAGLTDADIHVSVAASAVVLSGKVEHFRQKAMAEAVAARYSIRTVRNDITVTGD